MFCAHDISNCLSVYYNLNFAKVLFIDLYLFLNFFAFKNLNEFN